VVAAAVPVAGGWLTKAVLDGLTGGAPAGPALLIVAAALGAVGIVTAATTHGERYLFAEFGRRTAPAAQDQLYRSVNAVRGLRPFEDPAFLDRLRMAQTSGQHAPAEIAGGTLSLAQTLLTTAGFVGSLLVVSPQMAWLVLLGAGPALAGEVRLARARHAGGLRATPLERREFFYAMLLADVQAAKEVRLFAIGDFLRRRMLHERRAINAVQRGTDRLAALTQTGLGVLAAAVTGGGLLWAVWSAAHGRLTVGDLSMFVAAVAMTQGGVGRLVAGTALLHQHLLIFDHYRAVVAGAPDLPVRAAPRPLPALRGGIELRDVWFRYGPDQPWVLRGVTLRIAYGTTVGLVGLNGAGKSTLVKLLCRFYDPTAGSISWDGVDLRDVAVDDLRDRISAIFQDFMQYDLTAGENIALGDLAAGTDPAAVRAAAEDADIHDALTRLPKGYHTMLSTTYADADDPEPGVVLSGGQWQRLAIARSLLRSRRDLLILDEPSSGLDPAAEYDLHRRLARHRAGRTGLLVTHRLGALRDADHIVVLADGVVAESGHHDDLMRAGGTYAELFTRQAESYLTAAA
jgi:ATP-binding cassette subfamily B protein